jgi:hypothetical protein
MPRLLRVVALPLSLVLLAGCGGKSTARQRPVTPQEWKAVIRDSYDGRIDRSYRCAAVREAIERIPHDTAYYGAPGSASGAMLAFEKRTCKRRL